MRPVPSVLLTSFQTWMAEQSSNSSDDLLIEIQKLAPQEYRAHFLRQLPVDFEIAPQRVIAAIASIKPDIIMCCGMAAARTQLTVESQAVIEGHVLQTSVALDALIEGLTCTLISYDAGQFVCNRVYYDLLKHSGDRRLNSHCIFLHVPVLTSANQIAIVADTQVMLNRLARVWALSQR